jgi:hypothetical protein
MSPDLDAALVRDFPELYSERHLDVRESCMGRGFEVEDGWEPLIRRLSEKLEVLVVGTDAHAAQVKEKWGVLRFVMDGTSRDNASAKRLIAEAQDASASICETCGAPGELRKIRYTVLTACDPCFERRLRARRW